MKINKITLFASFLTTFTTLTQSLLCMETTSNNPIISIIDLKSKRAELKDELITRALYYLPYDGESRQKTLSLLYAYNQEYDKLSPLITTNKDFLNIRTNKNYSALGIATITPQNIPFPEQKEFIQKLFMLGFTPTPEDKGLAFLERWERISFDKMILLYGGQQSLTSVLWEFPHDLILLIAWHMCDLEESLF